MIDNENNINENGENNAGEDTQAFNWGWRADEDSAENPAQEAPEEAPEGDTPAGEKPAEEAYAEEASCEEDKPTEEKPEEKKDKKSRTFNVAAILSACSIILLVAFALSIMLGIFPLGGREIIEIGVSDLGQTQPNTEASVDLLEDSLKSVVLIQARTETSISTGTGVIISDKGYIVTNYHVIEATDTVTVQLYGEDIAIEAEVVGYHADDDVAVLKINKTGLRAAAFAKSDDVRYGERVYAIGNPEGAEFAWSIAEGIISSPRRQLMFYNNEGILEKKMNVVQTDAAVNHGNSGGPILNVRGEIVGIVTFKRTDVEGMGFALPADGVLIDVTAIIETGSAANVDSGIYMPRPLIGITGVGVKGNTYYKNVMNDGQSAIEEVTEAYAKANPQTTFYAPVAGVHVSLTSAGSDAAKYLKVNDVITEVNGKPVATIYDVMDIVNEFNGGDKITVTYYRDGKYATVELMLKTSRELD